jgi:hypothetical protein
MCVQSAVRAGAGGVVRKWTRELPPRPRIGVLAAVNIWWTVP